MTANVTGAWAGAVGNDGSYLDLTQTGASVTGTACTQPGKACFPITDGAVSGDRFTGKYATGTDSVTMDMKVAADNRSMQGTYAMTKCGCTEQVALGKQN